MTIPKLPFAPKADNRLDEHVPGGVRRFSNLGNWLSKPDKAVTRAEFWELLNRYEAGRASHEALALKTYALWVAREFVWYRRLWRWVWRLPEPRPPVTPLAVGEW